MQPSHWRNYNFWAPANIRYGLTVLIHNSGHFIIIIIKGIYIAQVRKGHKCAMSAEMAVWLRNCLYLYSYLFGPPLPFLAPGPPGIAGAADG